MKLSALLLLPLVTVPGAWANTSSRQEPRQADEPVAPEYSFTRGVAFLDARAKEWGEKRKCVTCHTNGLALLAQPLISEKPEEVKRTREFASAYLAGYLSGEKQAKGQHGSLTGMVATTAFLALSDARSKSGLQAITRRGIDYAWENLDESGTWQGWLQCNWPPFESDAAFGPCLMLIALGECRSAQPSEPLAEQDIHGAQRLISWLKSSPPQGLHDKAMRLWAHQDWPTLLTDKEERTWTRALRNAQGRDGGWSMAQMAAPSWKHDSGQPQVADSEAYPTAFSLYVLLQLGAKRESTGISKGLRWLRKHQRSSGAWFTASPRRNRKHFISHAATAWALLVLRKDQH